MLFLSGINNTPSEGAGVSASFALWVYSVIFALVAMFLYTIGALRALRAGRGTGKLLFTIAVFALCVTGGGALNGTAILIWNIVFAANLIFQIAWIFN